MSMAEAQRSTSSTNSDSYGDEEQLASFGYAQTLHRTWKQFESFMASFGALYIVGGCRNLFAVGIYSGGPLALWTSMLITIVCMLITAASLAEICSSIPLSGSIYIWAAEAGGKRWGRFFGFLVAFWVTTAWTSFVSSNALAVTNFLLSEMTVFERSFPGGIDYHNIKFRVLAFGVAQCFLLLIVLMTTLNPKSYTYIFKASAVIIAVDALLTFIWLPVGVSQTYGFQSAKWVFTSRYNGTGASNEWAWILSFLGTSGVLTGFDASGHIAEETKNASLVAARGIFWGCFGAAVLSFPLLILFMFCSPSLDVLAALDAPQPFVGIYSMALGKGGQAVMTAVAVIGLTISSSLALVAASRLIFGIARDGILPGSAWIGKVDSNGQPRNSILFIGGVASVLLFAVIGSNVAFTSLVSAGAVPTIAAYALIPFLRLTFTRGDFADARWNNGWLSTPFNVVAFLWNTFLLVVLFSPYQWPVNAENFNFASVIFGAVTIMAIVSYFVIPEETWLSNRTVERVLDTSRILGGSAKTDLEKAKSN